MGVDINTYRCRVGMFVPGGGCGFMALLITFGRVTKLLGSLTLIRILLVMAGIEQNPGPVDKYIFRYQYLLIEIGTDVIRRIFDVRVGNDFGQYLSSNSTDNGKLQNLILAKIITADQTRYLPPIDTSPKSSNFDITLLSCLLRNVCGLRGHKHPVWMNPASTDFSLEADLARLKECRNNLQHKGTVFISETDLKVKWNELNQILTRLNAVSGIPNLTTLINAAEKMDTDEEMKKRFDETIKAWIKMENEIEELKLSYSELKRKVENIEQTHEWSYKTMDMVESDFRNRLMKIYKEDCRTIPVSPLCDEDEEEVDFLDIYEPPSLYHVPYHRKRENEEKYSISSYKEIFCKDDRSFRKIYITGAAGVGKTSFCKRMSLLWCMSQSGESVGNKCVQNDIDFMAKFDFVFYISLGETHRKDIVTMIVDQLFCNENDGKTKEIYESIEHILRKKECIVIMDALDEWAPKESGKIDINQLLSDKCLFVTTCRPYKIENERLSPKHIDRQIELTGINDNSAKHYVTEIVKHMNITNRDKKCPDDFIRDVAMYGLGEQLRIPIIAAHLVAVWFDHELLDMSYSRLYSNIVDMLLKRAEKRKNVEFPSLVDSVVKCPDSLSDFFYLKKHVSLLKKICLLSFNVLFKQDKCLSDLVFTTEQLESEPYCVSAKEMDFLCKLGILSKNKVIGRFGKREQKLSYMHKTYLEYFAALFVSSFDSSYAFDSVVAKWNTISNVVQFDFFFRFFVGISSQKSNNVFEQIYRAISDDLNLCRRKAIFDNEDFFCSWQIISLQSMVIDCFNEISRYNDSNISLRLEDYVFGEIVDNANSNVEHLKQLLLLNRTCVKSLYSVKGEYCDEFDQIKGMQCLHLGECPIIEYVYNEMFPDDTIISMLTQNIPSSIYGQQCSDDGFSTDGFVYDIKFTECMLQNKLTLHTVCIEGDFHYITLIPELPLRNLQHLTSLSLSEFKMQHNSLQSLVKFLSDNVLMENVKLKHVHCDNHQDDDSDCTLTINLPNHTKLTSLYLQTINILCNNVNHSSLKNVTLCPLSERIDNCYIDALNCIKDSQLEYIYIFGNRKTCDKTMKVLTSALKTLPYIKILKLEDRNLHDDILLQLHPDVIQLEIRLKNVKMSCKCFHSFIKSIVNNKSVIKVHLKQCIITIVDRETHRKLQLEESVVYMSEYLTSTPTVNITNEDYVVLDFETTSCQ